MTLDTAGTIAADVRAGRITADKVTETTLARIAERDPAFNCFTAVLLWSRLHQLDKTLFPARSEHLIEFLVRRLPEIGSIFENLADDLSFDFLI